jgi:hypothetical protein
MATPPTKLSTFVGSLWTSDEALLMFLRDAGLLRPDASNDALMAGFRRARETAVSSSFGSSRDERVLAFLGPHLSDKGCEWSKPER